MIDETKGNVKFYIIASSRKDGEGGNMLVVLVYCHVKAEFVDIFRQACIENASSSVKEPGIARFDVLQDSEDPTRFTLVEVYRTPDAPARHRETAHYQIWRDTVAEILAEPRTRTLNYNVFPDDSGWA
jgi:autoinducer 2-degrading protein